MLGGMSWESSAHYYRIANELVRERLGGLHSARVLLASVDFADIEALQADGRWEEAEVVDRLAVRPLQGPVHTYHGHCVHRLADLDRQRDTVRHAQPPVGADQSLENPPPLLDIRNRTRRLPVGG